MDSSQFLFDPFSDLDLETAIRLRWVLRDIRSNRIAMFRPSGEDLATLARLGLIEVEENSVKLTTAGHAVV